MSVTGGRRLRNITKNLIQYIYFSTQTTNLKILTVTMCYPICMYLPVLPHLYMVFDRAYEWVHVLGLEAFVPARCDYDEYCWKMKFVVVAEDSLKM